MDWFERLTGFREHGYEPTRQNLEVNGSALRSLVNGNSYAIGNFDLISLKSLREKVFAENGNQGQLQVSAVTGDVRQLHQSPEFAGALFQVASQFNMLEMTGPSVTPEHGVTRYQHDPTQGPACAIAAGAATIFRNYFVPVASRYGQTSEQQLNGLADLGEFFAESLGIAIGSLWTMQNGYAMCMREGLTSISSFLASTSPDGIDALRGLLRIGVQSGVQVTDGEAQQPRLVSQAFCSALPVAYSQIPSERWAAFAQLVLEAAYEATLWAGVLNARRFGSNTVLLTRLGGGAFGNDDEWIDTSMNRALELARKFDLDVRVVCMDRPSFQVRKIVENFS